MKGKTLKPIILSAIALMFMATLSGQSANGSIYKSEEDSINCLKHRSTYREFFLINLYEDALNSWWQAFKECPASNERMYVDGVRMYRTFIDAAPEGPNKEGLIDTLLLIYDQRMEYFGDEGNVLGRKGKDLLTYRSSDMEQVQMANDMLRKSVELQQTKSQDQVLILLINSGVALNKMDKIEDIQVIKDYFVVMKLLDQLEGGSSRWARARTTIEEIILNANILTCEALNEYYVPQYEKYREDQAGLEKIIYTYRSAGCDRSDLFLNASEDLYKIAPNPESAHNMGILFITRNDFDKASYYLQEAVQGENIDDDTKAEWYYELAVVSNAKEEFCKAIEYAREAIRLNNNYGKALILLGDAYIASRNNLGDEFQQRAAFWAAADKYQEAARLDPDNAEDARKKLNNYKSQYPDNEEVFFRDMNDGDPYQIGGCINENTTVRSRK